MFIFIRLYFFISDTEDNSFAIKILAPIQKQMELSVPVGGSIFLECSMVGNPPPLLIWEKYGGILPPNRHSVVFGLIFPDFFVEALVFTYNLFNLGSLLLYNVTKDDEGSYLCKSEAAPGYNLDDYDHLPFVVYSVTVQRK